MLIGKLDNLINQLEPMSSTNPKTQKEEEEFPTDERFQEKSDAATRIQSLWRGYRARSHVILPKELRPFLEKNFEKLTSEEVEAFTQIISRESVNMLRDAEAYKGEGVRLSKFKIKVYEGKEREHALPKTLWLKLNDDNTAVRVQFYEKKILGKGTYKKVKESETLEITLRHSTQKPIKKEDTAIVRTLDTVGPWERSVATPSAIQKWGEEDLDKTRRSLAVIAEVFPPEALENDPNIKIAGIPKVIRTHAGRKRKMLEWEDVRFTTDLDNASKCNEINIDTSGTNTAPLKTIDKFRIIEGLLYTLGILNKKGKVHRDVKPKNVLLSYNPDNHAAEGFLTDFDFIVDIGGVSNANKYRYWDQCSQFGLVLPSSDIFGAAMCLAESLFSLNFSVITIGFRSQKIIDKQIDNEFSEFSKKLVTKAQSITHSQEINKSLSEYLEKMTPPEIDEDTDFSAPPPSIDPDPGELIGNLSKIEKKDPDEERTINQLAAELKVGHQLSTLLKKLYKADNDLYHFMYFNSEGQAWNKTLIDAETPLEEKLKIVDALYDKFPAFRDFPSNITDMRKELEAQGA